MIGVVQLLSSVHLNLAIAIVQINFILYTGGSSDLQNHDENDGLLIIILDQAFY